jgi:1,4-alpha-glucan branching enzyme
MGEEIGSRRRFPSFADYSGKPARKMRDGRVQQFKDILENGADMLDPLDPATFRLCQPYAEPWTADADLWIGVNRTRFDLRRTRLLEAFCSRRAQEPQLNALGSKG